MVKPYKPLRQVLKYLNKQFGQKSLGSPWGIAAIAEPACARMLYHLVCHC